MTQYERELSNLSYTNKDFGSIYPELLDLVKKISYKWDPSESDESDPGVVLLKLAAILADKNNYNIDKNVLELFPLSVTQNANARQIFDQCGYSMKYLQGATTTVNLVMINEPEITSDSLNAMGLTDEDDLTLPSNVRHYDIPMFTMVSDSEKSVVYTIVQHAQLRSDGETVGFNAIQGTANKYIVNGEDLITMTHLDYNNRLYFTESDIAENGIYINNYGAENWAEWEPVDNLVVQPLGSKCYKFGVEPNGNRCYIEFPTDINYLIGEGINITYIRTNGRSGNIRKRVLTQFYTNPASSRWAGVTSDSVEEITISAENVYITNYEAATNGKDIESIDEAFKNYQRVKTTFDTLITLKDYANFIFTSKLASNGFVCDRTNDIESSYKVIYDGGVSSQTRTIVRTEAQEVSPYNDEELTNKCTTGTFSDPIHYYIKSPEMSAFDLRVYALEYRDAINTVDDFYATFKLVDYHKEYKAVELEDALANVKCTNHNFLKFKTDRILLIKNRYPISARIIPQYRLTDAQQNDIVIKVTNQLYRILNSREMNFGEEVPYDTVYDAILASDPRIKAVVLDDISYETYAVYYHHDGEVGTFKELRIDDGSIPYITTTDVVPKGSKRYYTIENGIPQLATVSTFTKGVTYYEDAPLWQTFREDIFAKSVLAGVTPLFNKDSDFVFSVQHQDADEYYDVERITTNAVMHMNSDGDQASYTVQDNENIVITAPNLIVEQEYSTYVKYLHNMSGNVTANSDYMLGENEFIMFFWKSNEEDEFYQYVKYGEGTIISPTFNLGVQQNPPRVPPLPSIPYQTLNQLPNGKGRTSSIGGVVTGEVNGVSVSYDITTYITKMSGSGSNLYVLTGTQTIYVKKVNKITLNGRTPDGVMNRYPVYWVLNSTKINTNGEEVYELFSDASNTGTTYFYTLKNGEYLIYSNAARTQMLTLGAGTRIECKGISSPLQCGIIDYNQFLSDGLEYLGDRWQTMGVTVTLSAVEMYYEQIGSGNTLKIGSEEALTIDKDGVYIGDYSERNKFDTAGVTIEYVDVDGNSHDIPMRNDSEIDWEIYSILNIDCSPYASQKLLSNHTISWDNVSITGVSAGDVHTYISTDRTVDIVGGESVDVTAVSTAGGDPVPLAVLVYKSNEQYITNEDVTLKYSGENTVLVTHGTSAGTRAESTDIITLPKGEYVFRVSALHSKPATRADEMHPMFTLSVTDGGEGIDVTSMGASGVNPVDGMFYFTLSVTDTVPFKLTITTQWKDNEGSLIDSTDCRATYTISTLSRYVSHIPFDSYKDNVLSFISDVISKLDINSEFNYLYQIPDDDLIDNPLNAASFLRSSHIYNKYSICEWSPNSVGNDIRVTNKIKEGSYSV